MIPGILNSISLTSIVFSSVLALETSSTAQTVVRENIEYTYLYTYQLHQSHKLTPALHQVQVGWF